MVAQIDKAYVKTSKSRTIVRLLSYVLFEGRPLTTKGRWINYPLKMFYRLILMLPKLSRDFKPAFVIGTGRSGTTILGVVLSMHKEIGFLNEPKLPWALVNQKDDLIGSYLPEPGKYRLSEIDVISNQSQLIEKIYSFYSFLTRSSVVLDKYPEMTFRYQYVKKLLPDSKFIFLYRNGWDTCASINHWSERLGITVEGNSHDWWGLNDRKWYLLVRDLVDGDDEIGKHSEKIKLISCHKTRAAIEWLLTMKEGIKLAEKFPERVIKIKYEDLTVDTKNVMLDIFNYLNLHQDMRAIEYADSVLSLVKSKPAFSLPDYIEPVFLKYMRILGYL